MRVAVIGFGYVGSAITEFLMTRYDVIAKDLEFEQHWRKNSLTHVPIAEDDYSNIDTCDAAIVCVPTEMKADGSCDTSVVESVVGRCTCPYILIKSTVPPGTTKKLAEQYGRKIAFSPEYLGESSYFTPFWKYPDPSELKYHDFQIFGGGREITNFFIELFQPLLGPCCKYIQTDSTTAELVKYMENSWGATKVTFCNEFCRIAEVFDVDYRELRELFLLDGRIERMHTSVFKDNFGYGGKCFPKDINAIIHACQVRGYVPRLLVQVERSNKFFQSFNDRSGEKSDS